MGQWGKAHSQAALAAVTLGAMLALEERVAKVRTLAVVTTHIAVGQPVLAWAEGACLARTAKAVLLLVHLRAKGFALLDVGVVGVGQRLARPDLLAEVARRAGAIGAVHLQEILVTPVGTRWCCACCRARFGFKTAIGAGMAKAAGNNRCRS